MDKTPKTSGEEKPPEGKPKQRIETQIHRRKKAKAVYPMTDEWEDSLPAPGDKFKMPPGNMKKT